MNPLDRRTALQNANNLLREFKIKYGKEQLKVAALIRENDTLKYRIKKLTAPKWWQFWKHGKNNT